MSPEVSLFDFTTFFPLLLLLLCVTGSAKLGVRCLCRAVVRNFPEGSRCGYTTPGLALSAGPAPDNTHVIGVTSPLRRKTPLEPEA